MGKKIIEIVNNFPGGIYHFEIAMLMRNAYLASSMMSCSEVWYSVTQADIESLEKVDEVFLRSLMGCSHQVHKEMLYFKISFFNKWVKDTIVFSEYFAFLIGI